MAKVKVGINPWTCPYCKTIRECARIKAEILRRMGAPQDEIAKLERQKFYPPFHLKILKILTLENTPELSAYSPSPNPKNPSE